MMKPWIPYRTVMLILLFAGCKSGSNPTGNSDNLPPGPFRVTVDTSGVDPVVTWTPAIDPDSDLVTYSVFLNGEQLQTGLSDTTTLLPGLEFETEYSGLVVASDDRGGSSETAFVFITREIRIEWQVNFGDTGTDRVLAMDQTPDRGYIVAGYSSEGNMDPGNGSDDYRIMKLDFEGNIEWNRQYGGSSSDRAFSIQQTTGGRYIVAGRSYSTNQDVKENNGDRDVWLIELNAFGEINASNNLGGDRADIASSVLQTEDGGFIVAGTTYSSDTLDVSGVNHGKSDFWIVKLNSSLEIAWEKNYGDSTFQQAHAIRQTPDGGYIVAGSTSDDIEDNGSSDGWIIKLGASGELEGQTTLGGSGADQIYDIQQTSDNGYVVAGSSRSSDGDLNGNHGQEDFWVVKLDDLLNIRWSMNYGGSGEDKAYSVYVARDGGFLVAGSSSSLDLDVVQNKGEEDVWILKVSADGNLLWERNLGGSSGDVAHSILEGTDRGIAIAGYSRSGDGDVLEHVNNHDFWVVKLR